MNRKHIAVLLLLTSRLVSSMAADWEFKAIEPPPTDVALFGVTYGGGATNIFAAAGANSTWSRAEYSGSPVTDSLGEWGKGNFPILGLGVRCATRYPSGLILAGGDNASIFSSTDGALWVKRNNAFDNLAGVRGIAYNNGRYVAVSALPNVTWAIANVGEGGLPGNWINASIAELASTESYRAVTAYGNNGFALCGIRGTVRISLDGGATWASTRPFALNEADLLGIAWNGGQGLVCVGTSGRILLSEDGGRTWVPHDFGTENLNAVSWTGSEFIAVGDGGLIITSSDGIVWSSYTGVTSHNLLGLVCATEGELAGVTVIVGDAGTVIRAGANSGPGLPPPISLGDQVVCAGSQPPPLSVNVINFVTADWFSVPTDGTAFLEGVTSFQPAAQESNSTSVSTYWVQARDTRTWFSNVSRTPISLTTYERPTAVVGLAGSGIVCNGATTTIQATLTGNGPWTVTWASNNVVVATHTGVVGPLDTLSVSPVNGDPNEPLAYTYTVSALSDANCAARDGDLTGSAVVTVNPRPASVVSGNATICNGASTVVQASLMGMGPWTVTWASNNVVVATHTGVVGPLDTLSVSPVNGNANEPLAHTYTVSALSDANCTAGAGDLAGSAVVTVNPRPASVVSGNATICNGASTVVQASLTGMGPWTVTWSSNNVVVATHTGVVGPLDTLSVSPVNGNANGPLAHTYTVSALSDANCTAGAGDLAGSAVVTVNPRPASVVSGDATICNGASTVVRASLTGMGPWTVTWSSNNVVVATHSGVAGPVDTLSVSPVNGNLSVALAHTYTVSALSDANCTAGVGDLTGGAIVTVNPTPAPPVSGGDEIACEGTPLAPLAVTVPAGVSVNWYDSAAGGTLLAAGSPTYAPPVTAVGTYTYYAEAISQEDCVSVARTAIRLQIEACTPSLAIRTAGEEVRLDWYGNFELFSLDLSTDASSEWSPVVRGAGGESNHWIDSINDTFGRLFQLRR